MYEYTASLDWGLSVVWHYHCDHLLLQDPAVDVFTASQPLATAELPEAPVPSRRGAADPLEQEEQLEADAAHSAWLNKIATSQQAEAAASGQIEAATRAHTMHFGGDTTAEELAEQKAAEEKAAAVAAAAAERCSQLAAAKQSVCSLLGEKSGECEGLQQRWKAQCDLEAVAPSPDLLTPPAVAGKGPGVIGRGEAADLNAHSHTSTARDAAVDQPATAAADRSINSDATSHSTSREPEAAGEAQTTPDSVQSTPRAEQIDIQQPEDLADSTETAAEEEEAEEAEEVEDEEESPGYTEIWD